MRKLRFSEEAKSELASIARFIAKDKPVAARKWKQDLRAKCRGSLVFPEVGDARPFLGPRVRSTYFGNYVILFEWDNNHIDILQIVRGDSDIDWLEDTSS